jgi:hypothetical protein
MKKVGFIALALVTLLATLGIGFSMWSQTITISGTVNTGNVSLKVSNYTGTWAYKDSGSNLVFTTTQPTIPPSSTAPAGALWGTSYAKVLSVNSNTDLTQSYTCTSNAGLTIALGYSNLFPVPNPASGFWPWVADFDITNVGSIPIKLEVGSTSTTDSSTTTPGMPAIGVTYVNNSTSISAEGYQLEPGGVIHVQIALTVNESTVQSYNGTFSLKISGVQWNEYTSGTGGSVPRT